MAATVDYYAILRGLTQQEQQPKAVPSTDSHVEWRRKVTDRINEDKKNISVLQEEVQTLRRLVQMLLEKQLNS